MRVFDLKLGGDSRGSIRIGLLGSCRINTPFNILNDQGRARMIWMDRGVTHTVGEAAQNIEIVNGEHDLPDFLAPFVWEGLSEVGGRTTPDHLVDSIDLFVVEVCERKQIVYGPHCLQQNFFSRQFVEPNAAALLEWYRALSRRNGISPEVVDQTIRQLRKEGVAVDDDIAGLLASARIDLPDHQDLDALFKRLIDKRDADWLFVSHFAIPGNNGAMMKERRAFSAEIRDLATAHGAGFMDPTELLEKHGAKTALEDGNNPFEYATPFNHQVADWLVGGIKAHMKSRKYRSRATIKRVSFAIRKFRSKLQKLMRVEPYEHSLVKHRTRMPDVQN